MGERNAGLTADPLFVGVTRPPIRFGVTYVALAAALGINCLLGALMTLGVGLYAPCLILVSLSWA